MTTTTLLHTNPLAAWFLEKFSAMPQSFPSHGKTNYAQIFIGAGDYLNSKIHPSIVSLNITHDKTGYLTDHGPGHIEMVMRRAAELAAKPNGENFDTSLTPYESFLLLLAIHCHDVGNMYGREGHEQRILTIINDIPDLKKLTTSERRAIARIASAHGGTVDGDKDTIGKRLEAEPLEHGGKQFRPQLLAAVLRLADELSDETCRADTFALALGNIPPESSIYHRYASALTSVRIDNIEKKICLHFELNECDIKEKYGKGFNEDGQLETVYLLDEIHARTQKTFFEMIYCMRFMRNAEISSLSAVAVKIEAFRNKNHINPFRTHSYTIKDRGYPAAKGLTLNDLCDGFESLTGVALQAELEKE